jgi:glycosyltransferase involved in cell wall biosynthesis
MRVGLIAPPFLAVPPALYGGTELVIDVLARGLVEAGQEVRLFTIGDSTCPVPRRWWFAHPATPIGLGEAEVTQVTAAYAELSDVDVVHDHTLVGPLAFAGRVPAPVVVTCHSRLSAELSPAYSQIGQRALLVAISQTQADSAPSVPVAAVIHHGLDLGQYEVGPGDGDYLLFVARMCADKGPHHAIRIARAAGRRLVIVAKMREAAEVAFFRSEVEPLLGPDVEIVGELSAPERIRLLQGASALLNPIQWPEPFGLTLRSRSRDRDRRRHGLPPAGAAGPGGMRGPAGLPRPEQVPGRGRAEVLDAPDDRRLPRGVHPGAGCAEQLYQLATGGAATGR